MPTSSSGSPRRTDMVGKALALLNQLGDRPKGASLSELAHQAGYPLSTAHRLLTTLLRENYVKFDPDTKHYSLGLRVFQLAKNVSRVQGFSGLATPILDQISTTTREATMLAVLDGEHELYVYCNAGPQQLSVIGEPGKHGPLHCTSQGKVLIAFSPPDVREYLLNRLPLDPLGPNTITNRDDLRREIEKVRARGYAIADEEHEAGIRAIGVPVLDQQDVVAALATAAPAHRASLEGLSQHLPILTAAATELAAVMPATAGRNPNALRL